MIFVHIGVLHRPNNHVAQFLCSFPMTNWYRHAPTRWCWNIGWLSKHKSIAIVWTIDSAKALFDFVAGRRLYGNTTSCRRINICQWSSHHTTNNSTRKFHTNYTHFHLCLLLDLYYNIWFYWNCMFEQWNNYWNDYDDNNNDSEEKMELVTFSVAAFQKRVSYNENQ